MRRIAFLPERFNPPFYLTGRDFLQYMLKLHRTPYDETQVARTFGALDLDLSALTRPARTYSKGMTQKLGLAACLLSGKDLYIFDEPTSGLDPKARALLKRELRELRHTRRTLFFTSHALADVAEMCDRMAIVHAGRLQFRRHARRTHPQIRRERPRTGLSCVYCRRGCGITHCPPPVQSGTISLH